MIRFLITMTLCAAATLTTSARANTDGPCRPARSTTGTPPEPWQQPFAELLAATADPEQPWGCPDAALRLQVRRDGSAELRVLYKGGREQRRVLRSPDELVAVGKALLARASVMEREPLRVPFWRILKPKPKPEPEQHDVPAGPALPPSATLSAALAIRTVEPGFDLGGVLMGPELRGALFAGRWSFGLTFGYSKVVSQDCNCVDYWETPLMLDATAALVLRPVRFELGPRLGLAMIQGSHGYVAFVDYIGGTSSFSPATLQVDARLGIHARLVGEIVPHINLLGTIDTAFSPDRLAAPQASLHSNWDSYDTGDVPIWQAGGSVGLEIAVP